MFTSFIWYSKWKRALSVAKKHIWCSILQAVMNEPCLYPQTLTQVLDCKCMYDILLLSFSAAHGLGGLWKRLWNRSRSEKKDNSTLNSDESTFTFASSVATLSEYEYFISFFHYSILHYPHLPLSCMPSLSCSLTAAPRCLVLLLLCLGNVCSRVPDPLQQPPLCFIFTCQSEWK